MTHRIFLVEDHPITREGLRSLIRSAPDLEVVGEASSGPDAIGLIGSAKPDLVLADISIEGSDGIELTKFKWNTLIPLIQLSEGFRSLPLTVCGALLFLFSTGHLIRLCLGRDERQDNIDQG